MGSSLINLPKSVPITSYDLERDITLDTANGGAKRSSGCGKSTSLNGETRLSINVGGQNRDC